MTLAHYWWTFVVRGVVAVLFGLVTFVFPQLTLLALIVAFGVFAMFDGTFNLMAAIQDGSHALQPRWVLVVHGLLSLVVGIITFLYVGLTALVLLYLIAFWAIATGIAALAASVQFRHQLRHGWLLAFSGILSLAFGVLAVLHPLAGAFAVIVWIGAYAMVFGASLIALGFQLRTLVHRHTHDFPHGPAMIPGH